MLNFEHHPTRLARIEDLKQATKSSQNSIFSPRRAKGRLGLSALNLTLSALILATAIPATSERVKAQEGSLSSDSGETTQIPDSEDQIPPEQSVTEPPTPPNKDSNWEEVFRLQSPIVSEGAFGNFPFKFERILYPMLDTQGRAIRVVSEINLSAINDGRQDRVVGGQFMGNGLPPNDPNFSRSVWGVGQQEIGNPRRTWHVIQYYGNQGEKASIQTISEEDKPNIKLDIRLEPDGTTGTVAEFGAPEDQRKPFQMVRPLLDSVKRLAAAVFSQKDTRTEMQSFTVYLYKPQ